MTNDDQDELTAQLAHYRAIGQLHEEASYLAFDLREKIIDYSQLRDYADSLEDEVQDLKNQIHDLQNKVTAHEAGFPYNYPHHGDAQNRRWTAEETNNLPAGSIMLSKKEDSYSSKTHTHTQHPHGQSLTYSPTTRHTTTSL